MFANDSVAVRHQHHISHTNWLHSPLLIISAARCDNTRTQTHTIYTTHILPFRRILLLIKLYCGSKQNVKKLFHYQYDIKALKWTVTKEQNNYNTLHNIKLSTHWCYCLFLDFNLYLSMKGPTETQKEIWSEQAAVTNIMSYKWDIRGSSFRQP